MVTNLHDETKCRCGHAETLKRKECMDDAHTPKRPDAVTDLLKFWFLSSESYSIKIFDMCLRSRLFRMTLKILRAACPIRDVTPGPLSATDTCIVYHLTHFEASWNVILHTRYVSTCVEAGCGRGRGQRTKAICCGACYYSIVLNAHRVTSMADTDIDAVKKRNIKYNRYA
jgi:hypothetical protein